MDEIRRRTMRLPVVLTADELEQKKDELVKWTQTADENEAHFDAWLAQQKEERKLKEATIMSARGYASRAAKTIQAGTEEREVEVADCFQAGNIVTIRLDTEAQIAIRPANDAERQMLLAIPEQPAGPPECCCENENVDCPIHGPDGVGEEEDDIQDGGDGGDEDGSPGDAVS